MSFFRLLSRRFPDLKLQQNVSYRELTTLGVGGELPLLAEPVCPEELADLLAFLTARKIRYFVFGAGSNVVGMDTPYNGVGIRLQGEKFSGFDLTGDVLKCGAFCRLPVLARKMANAGKGGLSALGGIPGTVGGAIRMNAGANGVEIGSLVKQVTGYTESGELWSKSGAEICWHYRGCDLPAGWVITEVELALTGSDAEKETVLLEKELAARREREPQGRTAGCVFRNVSSTESAGKMLDQAGLKTCRIRDLEISSKHANYIVNHGNATAHEYLRMVAVCRRAVAEKFGFYLKLEQQSLDGDLDKQLYREVPALKVHLLCGGTSSEREVSLNSGAAVASALRNAGYEVDVADIRRCKVTPAMKNADVVYPVLHGGFGEDGTLQSELEKAGLRFVGSGSSSCKLIMDKILTKELLEHLQLPTAKWCVITKDNRQIPENLKFPIFLKVPNEGSTVGIIKVDTPEKWNEAVDQELLLADTILAEEMVDGVELTIPVVNGEVMPAIEIRPPNGGVYDYDAKYVYKNGHTEYFCPPQSLPEEVVAEAKRTALLFYRASGAQDVLRVDYIVSKTDNVPYILEANAIPGCTATSLVPKAARQHGISFERLTSNMVLAAIRRPVPEVESEVSGFQLKLAVWLFRLSCVLGALLLAVLGLNCPMPEGLLLLIAGVLLLVAEPFVAWVTRQRANLS